MLFQVSGSKGSETAYALAERLAGILYIFDSFHMRKEFHNEQDRRLKVFAARLSLLTIALCKLVGAKGYFLSNILYCVHIRGKNAI